MVGCAEAGVCWKRGIRKHAALTLGAWANEKEGTYVVLESAHKIPRRRQGWWERVFG